ncbi:endonuclease [Opitutaceae bacterium TAV5]|nr:endonuclease [Opitutaceae bacterium TAV5]
MSVASPRAAGVPPADVARTRPLPAFLCRHLLLLFLLTLAFSLPLRAAPAGSPYELTVATWNIRNYNAIDRRIDGEFRPDYPKPESEKTALRAVIRTLDADVLALQEIGGAPWLEELRRDLAGEGSEYPYRQVLAGADKVRCVAVLSRLPLRDIREHTDMTFAYRGGRMNVARGLLEVTLDVPAPLASAPAPSAVASPVPLTIFVLHLKSRLTTFDDDPSSATWRAREADVIRNRILRRFPTPSASGARFLIAGDFNDLIDSRPVRALLRRGNTPISAPLRAADRQGLTWTHFYARGETWSRVDNLLASPALLPHVVRAWIVDSPEVLRASDHRPVAATFRFPPAAPQKSASPKT